MFAAPGAFDSAAQNPRVRSGIRSPSRIAMVSEVGAIGLLNTSLPNNSYAGSATGRHRGLLLVLHLHRTPHAISIPPSTSRTALAVTRARILAPAGTGAKPEPVEAIVHAQFALRTNIGRLRHQPAQERQRQKSVAMVPPNGDSRRARSVSTWIHCRSPVRSANLSIRSCDLQPVTDLNLAADRCPDVQPAYVGEGRAPPFPHIREMVRDPQYSTNPSNSDRTGMMNIACCKPMAR